MLRFQKSFRIYIKVSSPLLADQINILSNLVGILDPDLNDSSGQADDNEKQKLENRAEDASDLRREVLNDQSVKAPLSTVNVRRSTRNPDDGLRCRPDIKLLLQKIQKYV